MGKWGHKQVGKIFAGDRNKQWGFCIKLHKLRANSDKVELLFLKELA